MMPHVQNDPKCMEQLYHIDVQNSEERTYVMKVFYLQKSKWFVKCVLVLHYFNVGIVHLTISK